MMVDWQKVADNSGIPVDVLTNEDMALYRQAQQANQAAMPQDPNAPQGEGGEQASQGGGDGGDMPFGSPDSARGFGTKGGASRQPGMQQDANPADDESGDMGLSDVVGLADCWKIKNGELVLL